MDDGTEVETAEAPEVDEAVETEARKQGWVPLDEFEGNHEDWTPADQFVKLGSPREMRRELKKTWKALEAEKAARQAERAEFAQRMDRFERMNKAQRAKLYADIEAARVKAVEEGDTERYKELNRQEAQLVQQEEEAPPPAKKQPDVDPTVEKWVNANPWFQKDRTLNAFANSVHLELLDSEPGLDIEENLAKVREECVKRFPEKFGKKASNGSAPRQASVESGGRIPAAKAGKGWHEIEPDDRKILKRHIEEGLYKDQAEAAKAYWS
jgi:hypothetical protein